MFGAGSQCDQVMCPSSGICCTAASCWVADLTYCEQNLGGMWYPQNQVNCEVCQIDGKRCCIFHPETGVSVCILLASEASCLQVGGEYFPDEDTCGAGFCDEFGSCCYATGPNQTACLDNVAKNFCVYSLHGLFDSALLCDQRVCPDPGAVCDVPATQFHCFYSFQDWFDGLNVCQRDNYVWNGEGSNCNAVDCRLGACCGPGECTITTETACPGPPDYFWADNATCHSAGCGSNCVGACCTWNSGSGLPPGAGTCVVAPFPCAGTFYGVGSVCPPAEFCNVEGICCLGPWHEQCEFYPDQASCEADGGIWKEGFYQCDLPGAGSCIAACCLEDFSCNDWSAEHCAAENGVFHEFKSCFELGSCEIETGPCCLCTGGCQFLTQAQCQGSNGLWLGDSLLGCTVNDGGVDIPINCNLHATCCSPPPCGPCAGGNAGPCCDPAGNPTPGCDNVFCCLCVCAIDPFCCSGEWDQSCYGIAAAAGGPCENVCTCPPP
jgi:hypothetical protein